MKLALGTVQFGLPYGIANQSGQVSIDQVGAILKHAAAMKIDTLDTAIAYGESEQKLGSIGVTQWKVISKLPVLSESCTDVAGWVQESVQGSLQRLKMPRLYGLLLHSSQQLLSSQGDTLYRALSALKGQGTVEKIGVSIYDPEELDALASRFQLDLVQAPFNILDRRLATSGWLAKLRQTGTEIHTRSAFLQGLLLMNPVTRPERFNRWQALWDQWHGWLDGQGLTPLQACLGFALSQPEIEHVVVGVDSLAHLQEILDAAKIGNISVPQSLSTEDLRLINPSNWIKQ